MAQVEDIRSYVASRIREMRTSYGGSGVSQEALAERLGVATNTISRWETGVYEPTLTDLDRLARELEGSILDFFPRVEDSSDKSKKVDALLRTASKLDPRDLDELKKYAEFRRARSIYEPKRAGRRASKK